MITFTCNTCGERVTDRAEHRCKPKPWGRIWLSRNLDTGAMSLSLTEWPNNPKDGWDDITLDIDAALAAKKHLADMADKLVQMTVRANEAERENRVKDLCIAEREARFNEAAIKNRELEAWKASMLAVEKSWDAQAVAKELDVRIGDAIHPQILPKIRELKQRIALLENQTSHAGRTHRGD